ncbi:MAG: DUF3084 domain-containing protein [Microcoleaceae cyanobacterium]
MTAGLIFVAVILILGGVIAVVSDRLGSKVGKARLSLFKLRPRKTAALVTVFTGTVLSGLTLAILFSTSKPLRRGVFQIDAIQERLNQSRKDLTRTEDEKERVQQELDKAKADLAAAMMQLNQAGETLKQTNTQTTQQEQQLQQTKAQLQTTQTQLDGLRTQINQINQAKTSTESALQKTQAELQSVSQQKQVLRSEIQQLRIEQEKLIQQRSQKQAQIKVRDQEIAQKDQSITERDRTIAERETRLVELEQQQTQLEAQKTYLEQQVNLAEQDVQALGRDLQLLREGNVGLRRGQVLASGLVRSPNASASKQVVDRLLQLANRNAINSVQIGNSNADQEQVVQITRKEVEKLISEIDDGKDYVVQVISSANYLVGETRVDVFTKAELNRLLFASGEVIAGTSIEPSALTSSELQQRLQQLIDASSFRARFVGVVDESVQISDERIETVVDFFRRLQAHGEKVELQAVAAADTYTSGPLKIELLARQGENIIFSTQPDLNPDLSFPDFDIQTLEPEQFNRSNQAKPALDKDKQKK